MDDLTGLARQWSKQTAAGRGIRLSAAQVDLLNALGAGELIAREAAKAQRELSERRRDLARPSAGDNSRSDPSLGEQRANTLFGSDAP